MKKDQYIQMINSLLPIPLYFGICALVGSYLKKFDIVGPVGSNGKPMFTHYSQLIFYGLLAIIAVGLIYSLVQAIKVKGWQRYALIVFTLLLLPIQYTWIIVTQVYIFGK